MKKTIAAFFLLMSISALGGDNWQSTDLGKYRVLPISLERPFDNEYVFEFDIKYLENSAPGMDHDIKLTIGDRVLNIQKLKVLTTTDCTNQSALVRLTVPRNFAEINFDGISFVNKKTNQIEKTFNLAGV